MIVVPPRKINCRGHRMGTNKKTHASTQLGNLGRKLFIQKLSLNAEISTISCLTAAGRDFYTQHASD